MRPSERCMIQRPLRVNVGDRRARSRAECGRSIVPVRRSPSRTRAHGLVRRVPAARGPGL